MSKEQSEVLRLADALEAIHEHNADSLLALNVIRQAGPELRRLHAENEALRAQIWQGVPVNGEWVERWHGSKTDEGWSILFQSLVPRDKVAYLGTGVSAEAVQSIVYAHNQALSELQRKPLTDEQDRALCEAYCNAASDEYFKARPQLDSDVNRRIFYAGHRKAWIEWQAAHGIEAAACAERDARIAELEVMLRAEADARRAEINARLELERQLEEARKDAERWLWWRKRWSAMCTESCARRAGIDLSNVYVQSPEQMDFVTDAAMQKDQR